MPKLTSATSLSYGLAVLSVALAAAIRMGLSPIMGERYPFIWFVVAVVATSSYGGFGPSLMATLLSGVVILRFFLNDEDATPVYTNRALVLLSFLFLGFTITLLGEAAHKARRQALAAAAEARRALEAQHGDQEWLRITLASIADAVITTDPDGRVASLNPAAERLTGWTAAEASGRNLKQVFHTVEEATNRSAELPVARVVGEGEVVLSDENMILLARDGTEKAIEHNAAPIRDDQGAITGIVIVFRDVTERKRAEEAMRESEERYRAIFSQVANGIGEADLTGRLIRVNDRYCQIVGHPREELIGRRFSEFTHPDDVADNMDRFRKLVAGGDFAMEKRYVRKDRSIIWGRIAVSFIRDAAGRPARTAAILEDITDRKRLEDELKLRMSELAEADRRKDDFLATLAHELRNPLAPLRTTLHLMAQPDLEERDHEADRAIAVRQVLHLSRLVDDLMDVARITKGKIELRREVVDLATIVGHAVEAVRTIVAERGHRLDIELPEGPIRLEADPTRLEQVLENLLLNAAKYTEPGGVIRLSAAREGTCVVLRVRDNGQGIAPEMLPSIFEMFVQVGPRADRLQGGLGIGLGLVKSLVELHQGRISAQSDGPGKGSEFVVSLPALDPCLVPPGPVASARDDRPKSDSRPPRRCVLVVDDNVDAANSLAKLLTRLYGQEVRVAHDGLSALAMAKDFLPHLLLLDIGMPGMDGYEVARRLRSQPEGKESTIVALTGWGQESDRQRSTEAGFDRHLVKPIDPDELRALLGERTVTEPGAAANVGRRL